MNRIYKSIAFLISLLWLATFNYATEESPSQPAKHTFVKSQIKELSGRLLLDGYIEATQPVQFDKYTNFITTSTPSLTPASGHALLFAGNTANQFIAKYSDGSTQIFQGLNTGQTFTT